MSENVVALARPATNTALIDKLRSALDLAERGIINGGAFVGMMPDGASVTMVPDNNDTLRLIGALRLLEQDVIASMAARSK